MHFTDRVSTSALLTLSTKYSYYDILDSKFFFFKLGLIGAYEEGKKKLPEITFKVMHKSKNFKFLYIQELLHLLDCTFKCYLLVLIKTHKTCQ